jgi:SsrA-binding protein
MPKKAAAGSEKIVAATHRKARHFYEILETFEAGINLLGGEVKSLREGRASLDGCFGRIENGTLQLFNFFIPPYRFTTEEPPDPRRTRTLLMHRREIDRLSSRMIGKGLTLVPLEVYFKRGWAKVELGLARGRKGPDRRDVIKKRDVDRETQRSFRGR